MLFPNTYIIAWMAASLCVSYSSFRSLFVYLFIPSARPETITTMIQYSEGYSYSPPLLPVCSWHWYLLSTIDS